MATKKNEAVGTSEKLSFDEAMLDALKKLPPAGPEQPIIIKLEEIIFQPGDIAGRSYLSVRISGAGV